MLQLLIGINKFANLDEHKVITSSQPASHLTMHIILFYPNRVKNQNLSKKILKFQIVHCTSYTTAVKYVGNA